MARSTGADSATLSLHPFDAASGALDQNGTALAADASLAFSASEGGVLVHRRGTSGASHLFEWVDNQGRPTGNSFEVAGQSPFNLSQDGTLLAYQENGAILLRDLARGVATRLVQAGSEPLLSADGHRVAYSVTGSDPRIVVQPSAGGTAEVVYESKLSILAEDWSSDGRFLATNEASRRGLIISLDKTQPPTVYADLPTGSSIDESRFSPDGKWLVYNAADSGRQEVYLVPLPPTGERWQLSVAGGSQGRWRRDGRAVYYLAPSGDLMTVDLQATPGSRPRIGRPQKLFATGLALSGVIDQYAVNADGSRFLLRRSQSTTGAEQLNVIVNWPGLLRAKP